MLLLPPLQSSCLYKEYTQRLFGNIENLIILQPLSPPYREDMLYYGCLYEEAFLEAYLVRRGFLGPVSMENIRNIREFQLIIPQNIQDVPNTLAPDTRNMILLLLRDQFVSRIFEIFEQSVLIFAPRVLLFIFTISSPHKRDLHFYKTLCSLIVYKTQWFELVHC